MMTTMLDGEAIEQGDLFSSSGEPEGFTYQAELISADEEHGLIAHIATLPLDAFHFTDLRPNGASCPSVGAMISTAQDFEQADPIPEFLLPLRERAAEFAGLLTADLAHALVTEYAPGTPIGWHRDRPVFEDVIGVFLLSSCTFRFRRKKASKWERYSLTAQPRSVYLMRGLSRWEWEHSIPEVEQTRYSVTFRTLRSEK